MTWWQPTLQALLQDFSTRNFTIWFWVPRIIFDNTEATEESKKDAKSIIRVLANKNFTHTVTDLDHHQNIYVFDGKETELEMSRMFRAYNPEFLCTAWPGTRLTPRHAISTLSSMLVPLLL